jgi:hypothetical protein
VDVAKLHDPVAENPSKSRHDPRSSLGDLGALAVSDHLL